MTEPREYNENMKKERLFYLDFVRAFALILILMTHYNIYFFDLANIQQMKKVVLTLWAGNLYIGDWGVSLFFIISGASLMYVYEEKCDWKSFYKKRFLSLYPMFWIAYAVAASVLCLTGNSVFVPDIPAWRFLFTILGMDGLLLSNGISTFYLLGEWFLGVIFFMYLFFPLLRKLLNEKPILLFILTGISFVGGLLFCKYGPLEIIPTTFVFVRLPELIFGMFFVKYIKKPRWWLALLGLAVFLTNSAYRPTFSSNLQTAYMGAATFLVLAYVGELLKKKPLTSICATLSKYSYAVFLVHHVVINQIVMRVDLERITVLQSYLLFGGICVVIAVLVKILFEVNRFVMAKTTKVCAIIKKKRK